MDEEGIIFNAYKSNSILKTDYDQYLIKKYVQEYIKNKKKSNIICNEEIYQYNGVNLIKFRFGIKVENYHQIDEAVNELLKINNYINTNAKKVFTSATMPVPIYYPQIYLNDFTGEIGHDIEFYDENYYIQKVKIDYVNYLKNNNIVDNDIPEKEIEIYYKPNELIVYNDGQRVKYNSSNRDWDVSAIYNIKKKDYCVQLHFVIKYIKSIESYEISRNGQLTSFKYNGKKYILDSDLNMKSEINGNKVPYEWTISSMIEFFKGSVEFDYKNGKLYLNI